MLSGLLSLAAERLQNEYGNLWVLFALQFHFERASFHRRRNFGLSDKLYFAAEPTRGMIAPAPMLGNPTLQVICRSNVVST